MDEISDGTVFYRKIDIPVKEPQTDALAEYEYENSDDEPYNQLKAVEQQDNRGISGYLQLVTNPDASWNPISSLKKLWFVLSKHSCSLLYYRMLQCSNPLGKINLSRASFTYSIQNSLILWKKFTFQIHSDGKVYELEASSLRSMLYWLQEMQACRHEYNAVDNHLAPRLPSHHFTDAATSSLTIGQSVIDKKSIGNSLQNLLSKKLFRQSKPETDCGICSELMQAVSELNLKLSETVQELVDKKHHCEQLSTRLLSLESTLLEGDSASTACQQMAMQTKLRQQVDESHYLRRELLDYQDLDKNTEASVAKVRDVKDEMEAYKMQNRFLNNEILEMNSLRAADLKETLQIKRDLDDFKANFLKLESRYIFCLEKLRGNDSTIDRLIVDQGANDQLSMRFADLYGFICFTEGNAPSHVNSTEQPMDGEEKDALFWEGMLLTWQTTLPQMKRMIRGGIPYRVRSKIWQKMTNSLLAQLNLPDHYYQTLLQEMEGRMWNPIERQIELDLLRTLTSNIHFSSSKSEYVQKLRRILLAYNQHNPVIGYCQGLNRIGAIALLVLNEEDAFFLLVAILDVIMPKYYYNNTMIAAHADQRVLLDIVAEKVPAVHSHLMHYNIDLSLFTFNWFLTIFVDNVPVPLMFQIWDVFLSEGCKVLFRYAVAILKYHEQQILALRDDVELQQFLKNLASRIEDVQAINKIAFSDLKNFSMKMINSKRTCYIMKIQKELAELDEARQKFYKKSEMHWQPLVIQSSDDEA